jgi:hypothetical protein
MMNNLIGVMDVVILTTGTAVLTGLITFFLTSIMTKRIRLEELAIHEKIHHVTTIQKEIQKHLNTCLAPHKTDKLLTAIIWIVAKLDGDPKKLGLTE